jgi:DivIVA domain-containing protein
MADDLTPDQVRARRFDAARKGYDRAQVDAFLADVVGEMERLASAVESSRQATLDIGIDDPGALARELDRIGGEVHAILEAARSAAAEIRKRASADAEAWTSEAKEASSTMLAEATSQSQALRASAWNEGTSLLSAATSQARTIVAEAKDDALFIRAEAEREALRLTGDAKRDREEVVRAARAEGEQIVESARAESEGVLAAAHQQADAAQERARALEERRAELLTELETARSAIGELEAEIDSRRQELEAPVPEPEPQVEPDERSHHGEDGGSVRIVSPSKFAPLRPVDAEELVAEVTALRSGRTEPPDTPAPDAPAPVVVPISHTPAMEAEPLDEPDVDEDDMSGDDTVTVISSPAAPSPDTVESVDVEEEEEEEEEEEGITTDDAPTEEITVDEVAAAAIAADEITAEVPVPEPPPSTPALPDVDAGPTGRPPADEIGSLFARLREDTPPEDTEVEDTPPEAAPSEDTEVAARGDGATPDSPGTAVAAPEPSMGIVVNEPTVGSGDTASTLPLQNAALRTIKRTLVDLQNETLECLRTDSAWVPDEGFTDRFSEPFASLTAEITGEPDDAAGRAFAADLFDALSSTIEQTRARGGGEREVASATSKVFRTWRSDEAERRVASTAGDLAGV